jgi:hypothetical protein
MAEQLHHVAQFAEEDRLFLQVLPLSAGAHGMLEGMIRFMTFADAPPVAYTEGPYSGQIIDHPPIVAKATMNYDRLRAAALPFEASLDVVRSVAKEYEHGR